jgi:hypothetical protein
MPQVLLVLTTMMAAASAGVSQPAPFACWVRGSTAQRPSPLDSATVDIDGTTVKVCYGRPSARSRTIMGGLVPFGEPWRLGANEATSISVPFAAEIAGVPVPPGAYSLYAIPGESSWKIVVNRATARWGIPIDAGVRARDVGAGTVSVEKLKAGVETLTLSFDPPTGSTTDLVIDWETTRVRIPLRRVGG